MLSGKINKIIFSAVLLFAIGAICYLIYGGIYYEAADDIVFQTYIYGLFNNGSNALPDTFGCFILISHPINFLHRYFPTVNWYDAFELSVLIICLLNFYRLISHYVKESPTYIKLIATLFCFTITGVFFLPVEFTKTAIFLSGISLIRIYGSASLKTRILYGLLFFVALLIRIESGILAFVFVSAFAFAMAKVTMDSYLTLVQKSLWPLCLIIFVSVLANLPKTPEEDYYKKIRPYEFALTDFDREKAVVTLTSVEDSVIFRSCVNFFFADSSRCNMAFFKKIGLLDFDKTPKSLMGRILNIRFYADKYYASVEILKELKWLMLVWVVLMFWLPRSGRRGWPIFIMNILMVLLLAFISLWLKPEEHVICPAMMILILMNVIWILKQSSGKEASASSRPFILISLLLFLPGEMFRQYSRVQSQRERYQYYSEVADYLAIHPAKNIILNIGTWDEAHHKMFEVGGFNILPNAYVLDGAILYFNDDYQDLMKRVTGSKVFIEQWRYFIATPGTGFVCTRRRMDMIMDYLHVIYHDNYVVSEIKKFDVNIPGVEPLMLFGIAPKSADCNLLK